MGQKVQIEGKIVLLTQDEGRCFTKKIKRIIKKDKQQIIKYE
jgi:hypothetical protein